MKVDDFVRTSTDAAKAASDLANNESTDAVNSGIVGSADKSGMLIKDPLYGSKRTDDSLNELDPFSGDMSSSSAQQRLDSKSAVTMGSTAQQKADELVSSASVTKKAASMLKQTGGKVAADRLVTSRMDNRKLLSGNNLTKAVKGAVVSEALRDTELEGADDQYYRAKTAWKLGRKGASAISEKAAAKAARKAARDVTGGASDATRLLESRKSKETAQAMQRRTQALRNQRNVYAAAQSQKAGMAGLAKTGAAKGGVAVAGGGGGIGAAVVAVVLLLILVLSTIMSLLFVSCTGGGDEEGTGTLTGVPAEIATTLQGYGFTNEAIAAILGNFTAESTGDYGNINANTDSDDGFGTVSLGIMQMTGFERITYLSWCIYSGKQWSDVSTQMEWAFSNEGGTESGYFANRWQMVGLGVSYYDCEPGWQSRFRTDWYRSGEDFKNSTDVDLATFSWMACYERCGSGKSSKYPVGVSHLDKRLDFAQRYLAELNTSTDSSGGTAPADANAVVQRAYAELGKPYKWGAVGPSSYDCSGLVSYCLTGGHSRLGTTGTFMGWKRVSDPQPGDVCTNDHHCGIYIGNGQMIHAPQTGDVVKISNVHKGMIYVRYGG